MNNPREPLACPSCQTPYLIHRVDSGYATVQPGDWWHPITRHWEARCVCNLLTGSTEGELYRAMGINYA